MTACGLEEPSSRLNKHISFEEPMAGESQPYDFARIYEAYFGKVRAYAAKLIGQDDADDVANEVFAKVDRALGTLTDPSRLTSWIYAITINTVRDAVRARSSRERYISEMARPRGERNVYAEPPDVADSSALTPEATAARNEMIACYLEYVKQLPRNYFDVYVLSELEQLSNGEIADRLSLSVNTVKIRLHRARSRLYEELRRHCQCYYNERGELMAEPRKS